MIKPVFNSDFDKVSVEFSKYARNIDKATSSALNKVAKQGSTEAKRAITDEYTVKRKDIRLFVRRASRNYLRSEIHATSNKKGLSLTKFKARQLRKGVKVSVRKGKTDLLSGAFIQTMASGHKGVFYREGDKRVMSKGRYAGKSRQPIVERFGPSTPQLFQGRRVRNRVVRRIEVQFEKILSNEINYYAKR